MRRGGFKDRLRHWIFACAATSATILGADGLPAQTSGDDFEVAALDYDTAAAPSVVKDSGGCVSDCGDVCFDCCSEQWYLFPQSDCGLNFRGWFNAGVMLNSDSPASHFNGPYNAVDRSNEAMLNQAYLIAEKNLPQCDRGIGGRIDVIYGEDHLLAQSIGLELHDDGTSHWNSQYYGVAIPQAYLNFGSQALNLQVGHFYSVVGYEGVMAPDNFFYSKSYSYQFAGPFTHWGGMVNWSPSDQWTFNVGLTNGWDGLDRTTDRLGMIARAKYTADSGVWTSFAVTSGQEYNNAAGLPLAPAFANRTRYSWLVGLPLTSRLDYVFHQWLGAQQDGAPNGERADWYGIDQYLVYNINCCWKAALRFEWFNDEEGTRVGLNRPSNPNNAPFAGDFLSISAGLNWMPSANFIVRPEVRYDWFNGVAGVNPYNDGLATDQLMVGFDAILKF